MPRVFEEDPSEVDGLENGIPSLCESNFLALVKTFDLSTSSFSIAFLPSSSNPLGTLPSGHMPLSYITLSFSSLKVLNIFIILLIARTLFLSKSASILNMNIILRIKLTTCFWCSFLFNNFLWIYLLFLFFIWDFLTLFQNIKEHLDNFLSHKRYRPCENIHEVW